MARAALAPDAVILGLATFQFGWALVPYLRLPEGSYYDGDLHLNLFVAFTVLVASAALCIGRTWSNLLAVASSSPLPLVHIFMFWAATRRSGAALFSVEHLKFWIVDDLSSIPAIIWLASVLSFAVLSLAAISALRQPYKPQARGLSPKELAEGGKLLQELHNVSVLADERRARTIAHARGNFL
jgi:lipid-A-disaccharide synthase-like uncharacterized protein